MEVEFVCLANSTKLQGRCVAGLRTDGTGWFRLVSRQEDGTLYSPTYMLDNGREALPLDILRVDVSGHRPEPHQPENWTLTERHWHFVRQLSLTREWSRLEPFVTKGLAILGDTSSAVSMSALRLGFNTLPSSLCIVEPINVSWLLRERTNRPPQPRALFYLGLAFYNLPITDPQWGARFVGFITGMTYPLEAIGIKPTEKLLFTISLAEPFRPTELSDEQCYKLVAAVLITS